MANNNRQLMTGDETNFQASERAGSGLGTRSRDAPWP